MSQSDLTEQQVRFLIEVKDLKREDLIKLAVDFLLENQHAFLSWYGKRKKAL